MTEEKRQLDSIPVVHFTTAHSRHDTRVFIKQCKSLAAAGFDVTLVVADGLGDKIAEGVKIVDIGKPKGRLCRITVSQIKTFFALQRLPGKLYQFHDPELLFLGLLLKLIRKRVVFDMHELTAQQILTRNWIPRFLRVALSRCYSWLESIALPKFDLVLVPQQSMAEEYKATTSVLEIYNYPNRIEPKSASQSRFKLMYSGSITAARGFDNMMQLIESLVKYDARYSLVLAGPIEPACLDAISKSKVASNVNYLGFLSRDELYAQYANAAFGLILLNNVGQYHLAYSLKLFEYMQNKMVVVLPNFGEWPVFNSQYKCGISVDVTDADEIASRLVNLEDEWIAETSNKNASTVREKFCWENEEAKLVKAYYQLLK